MRTLAFAAMAAVACLAFSSASAEEWMVEAHWPDRAALHRATAQLQHAQIDAERQLLRVDVDEAGIAMLEAAGLTVSIDLAGTAQLRDFRKSMDAALAAGTRTLSAGGYPSIPGFACYRTVEGAYQTMDDLALAYPQLAAVGSIGPSWEKSRNQANGHEMRVLRLTNFDTLASDPQRPAFVAYGSIHAREYTPAELLTRFAEWLATGYGIDPQATWLLDHVDFHLILMANPDGRKKAETGLSWRKNTNNTNGSCGSTTYGIDLNRNFPFHWNTTGGQGSSGNACAETYRGPTPMSEPETVNLVTYVAGTRGAGGVYSGGVLQDRRPDDTTTPAPDDYRGLFFDVHSYSKLVLWSWGDVYTAAPNDAALRTLGRRMAWFNGYTPQAAVELYPTDGTTDDTFYGLLGAPSYTIELGTAFFEGCASFESSTYPINLAALRYAARAAHAPYRLPYGPDTLAVTASPELVAEGDPIRLSASLHSGRFNQSNGTQATYPIASAAAYVGTPPWASGAAAIPLAAADGAFNATQETATGSLPTAGLADGRYLVFVQGTDSQGRAGTPDAALVDVAPAAQIAALAGTVTALVDGAPLAASVTVRNPVTDEERVAQSSAADGSYLRTMRAGTVDVRVSAPGHLAEELLGVALAGGQQQVRDFALLSVCERLFDDVEQGGANWSAQSPWVIGIGIGGHAGMAWHTPGYPNNASASLTLAANLDLSGYADAVLEFEDRCATEANYDVGRVEYSSNGGGSWTEVYSCSGRTAWQANRIELPAAAGGSAFRLRFRLQSDASVNAAGWAVDNIRLSAGGQACRDSQTPLGDAIFADGFGVGPG